MGRTILCIDREKSVLEGIKRGLQLILGRAYKITLVQKEEKAFDLLADLNTAGTEVPLIFCPVQVPGMKQGNLLAKFNQLYPEILKIAMVSKADISQLETKNGLEFFGYLSKPWQASELSSLAVRALRVYECEKDLREQRQKLSFLLQQVEEETEKRKEAEKRLNMALEEMLKMQRQMEEGKKYIKSYPIASRMRHIIGKSEAIQYVMYRVEQVASSSTTVLIQGETGTGKELVAQAIHNQSPRQKSPLIKVNCAALPSELIENELFGHEKGAFTGAQAQKVGKFELANHGTLFLDEIGELPLKLQAKILRAIESGEIERLGGIKTMKIDVRIIAATNRNLDQEIDSGNFRQDLYYRLNVYPVTLPPLRQRKDDIELLTMHFIKIFNKKIGRNVTNIPTDTLSALLAYDWPGNVRELENIIERGLVLSRGNNLHIELPNSRRSIKTSIKTLEEAEKEAILEALRITKGRISGRSGAANYLAINASTLRSKMKKLGIEKKAAWSVS